MKYFTQVIVKKDNLRYITHLCLNVSLRRILNH